MNLDAYTIRKIAPKLLIAVIGVNLSIYLCVVAIDITNIVGGGLGELLRGPFLKDDTFKNLPLDGSVASGVVGIVGAGALGAVVAGVGYGILAAGGIGIVAALGLFLISLAGIALIALAVLATLVIRYGAIIFLTIISPIAIACWVLPGTEKYFRQWWDIFLKALLVYPIVAVFFAVSDILGAIFLATNGSVNNLTSIVSIFVIIFVLYAPLFMIPFAFKLAGGILGSVYDFAQQRGVNPLQNKIGKWKENPNSFYATRKAAHLDKRQEKGFTFKQFASGVSGGIGGYRDARKRGADGQRLSRRNSLRKFGDEYGAASSTLGGQFAKIRAKKAQEELEAMTGTEGWDDMHELMSEREAHRREHGRDMTRVEQEEFLRKKNSGVFGWRKGQEILNEDGSGTGVFRIQDSDDMDPVYEKKRAQAIAMVSRLQGSVGGRVAQLIAGQQAADATTFGNHGGGSQMLRMSQRTGGAEIFRDLQAQDMKKHLKQIMRMDEAGGSSSKMAELLTQFQSGEINEQEFEEKMIDSAFEKITPQQMLGMDHNGVRAFVARGQQRLKEAIAGGDINKIQAELANIKTLHEGITYSSVENKQDFRDEIFDKALGSLPMSDDVRKILGDSSTPWEMIEKVVALPEAQKQSYLMSIRSYDPRTGDGEGNPRAGQGG